MHFAALVEKLMAGVNVNIYLYFIFGWYSYFASPAIDFNGNYVFFTFSIVLYSVEAA